MENRLMCEFLGVMNLSPLPVPKRKGKERKGKGLYLSV